MPPPFGSVVPVVHPSGNNGPVRLTLFVLAAAGLASLRTPISNFVLLLALTLAVPTFFLWIICHNAPTVDDLPQTESGVLGLSQTAARPRRRRKTTGSDDGRRPRNA